MGPPSVQPFTQQAQEVALNAKSSSFLLHTCNTAAVELHTSDEGAHCNMGIMALLQVHTLEEWAREKPSR